MEQIRHRFIAVLTALGTAVCTLSAGSAQADAVPGCADVQSIVARASGEEPGTGIIGTLAAQIAATTTLSTQISAVDYPAWLFPYDYSSSQGDAALTWQLSAEVRRCPAQRIVLLGYSQGAQLVGDVLGGGGGVPGLGGATPPVPASISSHVVAVVQMGDPRHMPGKSFDRGTAPGGPGLFPRRPEQALDDFAARIASYCDQGDPFCAGGNDGLVHATYTFRYNNDATAFVIGELRR